MKFGMHVGLEVKMCKTVLQQWWKVCCLVTTYYAKNCGEKSISKEMWHIMLALKCRMCKKHF